MCPCHMTNPKTSKISTIVVKHCTKEVAKLTQVKEFERRGGSRRSITQESGGMYPKVKRVGQGWFPMETLNKALPVK